MLSALFTSVTIRVCTRRGWVARPHTDRWHRGTPSLFGGVPIWIAFVLTLAIFLAANAALLWKLVGISSVLFLLGLVDDILGLSPRTKLLVQGIAASVVLALRVIYPFRESLFANLILSSIWIIGITNAFNLLDNMDGLSAGIALIATVYLAVIYLSCGSMENVIVLAVLAGVVSGFLLFNFNPARIFMGDAGSLFIGFLVATVSLLDVTHLSSISAFLFVPVLVLTIPIFDTFFVSVTRRLRGQPISKGGTDHSSHRLVRLGLNERSGVLVLYGLSAASGAIALGLRYFSPPHRIGLIALWFLFLILFGIHLFQAQQGQGAYTNGVSTGLAQRVLNRDTLAILLDPTILSVSYYSAFFFRLTGKVSTEDLSLFFHSWPIILGIKFLCLWSFGIYRRSWWRGSRQDLYRLFEALLLGELLSVVALVGVERFAGYSRAVFALDAVISSLLVMFARQSSLIFRDFVRRLQKSHEPVHKVFVLGTSQRAEVVLRFLGSYQIKCLGLIDLNHGSDLGRQVWGVRVVGHLEDLPRLAKQQGVQEIVLPENEPTSDSEEHVWSVCQAGNLKLLRLGLYHKNEESNRQHSATAEAEEILKGS